MESVAGGKSSSPMFKNSKGKIVESPVIEADEKDTPLPFAELCRPLFSQSIEHVTDEEFETVPKYVLHTVLEDVISIKKWSSQLRCPLLEH